MLSVIIPARNEKYLQKTIENVLENATGQIEIIAVCDGYWPSPAIKDDPRVNIIHHTEARGQRPSINEAVKIAKGEYVMKLDAHCAVSKGFDEVLLKDIKDNWIVVPRMYNLDPATWTPKLFDNYPEAVKKGKVNDYMYIGFDEKNNLRTLYYTGELRKKLHLENLDKPIDETMSLMGCCFVLKKSFYAAIGGCDENHYHWGQQGVEMACKAWLSGGKLVVNKNAWFAHWFRASDGGWPYPITDKGIQKSRDYSKDFWLNNKWDKQVKTFNWLVEKFNPPGWETFEIEKRTNSMQRFFYHHIHLSGKDMTYRGIRLIKMPSDLVLYQQAIYEKKPDFIIDIGTAFCGSALLFADSLEINGKGRVISIDPSPRGPLIEHPRITYLNGDSKSDDIINQIKEIVGDGSVMVSIDGNHARSQVKWELLKYSQIVTQGQYMVAEDCYDRWSNHTGVYQATEWFLKIKEGKDFIRSDYDKQFLIGYSRDGWLLKK